MENSLNRRTGYNSLNSLAPRPSDYGGLPGKIVREDDAGYVYDETGRRIFNKFDTEPTNWMDTTLNVATAPARIATEFLSGLSPYGADGWQVPPIINEGVDALTAVGDAYTQGMGQGEINRRALGMAGFMMGGGGLAARPAGGTGMFAGRLAKTADQEALARAERMAAEGADRNAIWNETGWFKGPDQKWRFEIDDSGASFDPDMPIAGLAYNHNRLFDAYPDFANATVVKGGTPHNGLYDFNASTGVEGVHVAHFADDPKSIALHEGQHALQRRERFARGGNLGMFTPEEIAAERARVNTPEPNDWSSVGGGYGDAPDTDVAFGLYKRLAGEVEARNVQTRMTMSADQRRATPPWETQDIPFEDQIVRLYSNSDSRPALLAGGLDMSQEARLARAREMGFDTDSVLYHGSLGDIDEFSAPHKNSGLPHGMTALSDSFQVANSYTFPQGVPSRRGQQIDAELDKLRLNYENTDSDKLIKQLEAERRQEISGLKDDQGVVQVSDRAIYPLYARATNPFEIDAQGNAWHSILRGPKGSLEPYRMGLKVKTAYGLPDTNGVRALEEVIDINQVAEWAKQNGYDGLRVKNVRDWGSDKSGDTNGASTTTIVFDPKNIRSVNAAFDPAKSDSAKILAANGDSRPALLAMGQEIDQERLEAAIRNQMRWPFIP